jgi:hypothetical protein
MHIEQTRLSSRISKPIQKSGKQKISITTNTIHPLSETLLLICGGAVVPQRGQRNPSGCGECE